MHTRMSIPRAATRLCLEHGADETSTDSVRVEERGATFESPWQFEPLAELLLCLAWQHPRLGNQRTPINGIVVDSRRITNGRYETVVLFPELPEAHKLRVREFARFTR
jgi:hypothetical protein